MPQFITAPLYSTLCNYYGCDDISWKVHAKEKRLLSDIIICDLNFPNGRAERICIKKYKEYFSDINVRLHNEFVCSRKYSKAFSENSKFLVVDNICLVEEELTLVSTYVPGEDLYHFIRSPLRLNSLKEIFYGCGLFMREFHCVPSVLPVVDFNKFGEYIDVRLKNICKFDIKRFSHKDRDLFLAKIMQLCEAYKNETLQTVGLHGDFIPPNIRVKGDGKLCLLDFSNVRSGMPYDDIAYFLVFMWCHDLLMPRSKTFMRALIRNFMEGYRHGNSLDLTLLSLYCLKHLINRMWGILRSIHNEKGLNMKKMYWHLCYSKIKEKTNLMVKEGMVKNQPFSEIL